MLYVTSRCNSRCRTCLIWKKEHEDLPVATIEALLESRAVTGRTRIGVEGGEALLHPEIDEILRLITASGRELELLTNGLMPSRLENAVRRHRIPRVYVSIDGTPETYAMVRGVDSYHLVIESIERIRDLAEVSVMYLISPWNDAGDLAHVAELCRGRNLDLRVGIYHEMAWFDTIRPMTEVGPMASHTEEISDFRENRDYLELFEHWRHGRLVLPCLSIRQELVVHPSGNVPLCQSKDLVLGNLHDHQLDEILTAPRTRRLQREHLSCNGCWISFHRKLEVALFRQLRWVPRFVLRQLFGEIQLPG